MWQKRFGAYLTVHDFPSDENATGRGAIRSGIDLQKPPDDDDDTTATHPDAAAKGSKAEGQQRRAEDETPAQSATLATRESENRLREPFLRGLSGISGSKGSKGSTTPSGADDFDEVVI